MSTQPTQTGNPVKSTNLAALHDAIEVMDSLSQTGFGQIEAIAALALAALDAAGGPSCSGHVATALEAIKGIASGCMNSINGHAEEMGSHWINEPLRRRSAAR